MLAVAGDGAAEPVPAAQAGRLPPPADAPTRWGGDRRHRTRPTATDAHGGPAARRPWTPGRRPVAARRAAGADGRSTTAGSRPAPSGGPLAGRALAAVLARPELLLRAAGRRPAPVERDGRVLNRGVQALLGLTVGARPG